jgi:hypothetical protein
MREKFKVCLKIVRKYEICTHYEKLHEKEEPYAKQHTVMIDSWTVPLHPHELTDELIQMKQALHVLCFWTLSIILSLSKNCPVYF